MPETPDFNAKADTLLDAEHLPMFHPDNRDLLKAYLVSLQREMWNTRGAADIALIDQTLGTLMGIQAAGPYVKNLDRALRALDR